MTTAGKTSAIQTWLSPGCLVLHVACLCLAALCWLFDEQVYNLARDFYWSAAPINGEVHQIILSLAMYGQALGIITSIALIMIFDVNRRGRAATLGLLLIVVGLSSSSMKALVGRERPMTSAGRTIVRGPDHGLAGSRHHSFPSGHTSTAFAMSAALAGFYPQARAFVWPLALGVGANRIITIRHFPSDVVAGAWLGYVLASWVLSLAWIRRVETILNMLAGPKDWSQVMSRFRIPAVGTWPSALASPWLLVFVSLAIHWAGNSSTALWDRDEPRFATATREMLARGDLIVPTFNGELRPDKPILIYWLMAAAYHLFGDGTFAARFFSGLAGTAACLMTFQIGRSMFDRKVALIAAWMLALAPMLIVESKLATVDAILLFCVTSSFYFLWRVYKTGCWRSATAFWIALGLSILAKGPVGLGVVGLSLVSFCMFRHEWAWLRRLRPVLGVAVLGGIVAPWCIAVQLATDGELLRTALGHHVIRRSFQPLENHKGFPGYYVVSLLGLLAPWAWLLPWSIKEHWTRFRADSRLAFLAAWSVATLVLFELVETKLVHYYLPAYPALVVLIASALLARFEGQAIGLERLRTGFGAWLAAGAVPLGIVFCVLCARFMPEDAAVPAIVAVIVFSIGGTLAGLLLRQREFPRAFAAMAASIAVGMIVVGAELLPKLSAQRAIVHVAERLRNHVGLEAIALWNYRDPSLIYNMHAMTPLIDFGRTEPMFTDALALALRHRSFLCPMTEPQFAQMSADAALELQVIETVQMWDLDRFKERIVHIVRVCPSDNVAEIMALRQSLAEKMPESKGVYIPIHQDEQAAGDSRRVYGAEPASLSSVPQGNLR